MAESKPTDSAGESSGTGRPDAPGAFTERFEIEFGEFRPSLFDDSRAAPAANERAASVAPVADLRQPASNAPVASHHRDSVARTGWVTIGASFVVALIVVGSAAYYVYEHAASGTQVADAGAVSPPNAQQQPAAETKVSPAPPQDAAPPSVATTSPTESTPEAIVPTTASETANTVSSAPQQQPVGARAEPSAATKAKSTAETKRSIAGPFKGAGQPAHPTASSDPSAIATQRIIERELVGMPGAPQTRPRAP